MRISLVSWTVSIETDPSWNLSLVLHQLTKAPFEPIKEASLKHLTFKMVFLSALGLGKCMSEIHAWSKVSLYPAPSFLSRTSLQRRVQNVWPQWLYQPWPHLWISHSSLIGPFVWSGHLDRASDLSRTRSWSLSPLRKVLTKTSHLPLSFDRQGPPNRPHYQLTRGLPRFRQHKRCYDIRLSRQKGDMMRNLPSAQNMTDQPVETQEVFF